MAFLAFLGIYDICDIYDIFLPRAKIKFHKTYNNRDLHGRSAYSKNTTMAGQHTAKKGRSAKGFLAGQHKAFSCLASADPFKGPVTAC